MMSQIPWEWIAAAAAGIFGIIASAVKTFLDKRAGRKEAEYDQMQDRLNAIEEANDAIDELDADPELRKRVRDEFTRDER